MESGNKVGIAHFEASKFRCHASDGRITTKLFYLLPPVLGGLTLLLHERHTFLHFLTLFDRPPYLVLLGARLTVLGHNLEKYESSAILSGRPPTRKIITFLIAYRQPPPPKQKRTENSNFLFKNLRNSRKLRTSYKNPNFFNFGQDSSDLGISLLSKDRTTIQRPKGKNCKMVYTEIIEQTVSV